MHSVLLDSPALAARAYHAMATVDGVVLVVGGFGAPLPRERNGYGEEVFTNVWSYRPILQWRRLDVADASLPVPSANGLHLVCDTAGAF